MLLQGYSSKDRYLPQSSARFFHSIFSPGPQAEAKRSTRRCVRLSVRLSVRVSPSRISGSVRSKVLKLRTLIELDEEVMMREVSSPEIQTSGRYGSRRENLWTLINRSRKQLEGWNLCLGRGLWTCRTRWHPQIFRDAPVVYCNRVASNKKWL